MAFRGFLIIILFMTCLGHAQVFDTSFNTFDNGMYEHNIGSNATVLPNGDLLTIRSDSYNTSQVLLLNSDGHIKNILVNGLSLYTYNTSVNSSGKFAVKSDTVKVFNADGTPSAEFSPPEYTGIKNILLQDDGKIMIVGDFWSSNNHLNLYVARLNSDGSIDNSFSSQNYFGTLTDTFLRTIVRQPDGKYLVGGYFKTPLNTGIARLNSDGTLDNSFNVLTTYTDIGTMREGFENSIGEIALQNDGKIIVSGSDFREAGRLTSNGLVRLNANGSRDRSFNYNVYNHQDHLPHNACLQNNGKIIFFRDSNIYRVNSSGEPDQSFVHIGKPQFRNWPDFSIQNGKIIVNESYQEASGKTRYGIHRLNDNGSLDLSFNPQGGLNILSNERSAVFETIATNVLRDSKIMVTGVFSSYNDNLARNLCRLTPDGLFDSSFTLDPSVSIENSRTNSNFIFVREQADGKLLVCSKPSLEIKVNNVEVNLVRLNANGSLDTSFSVPQDITSIYSFHIQSDGKIILGGNGTSFKQGNKYKVIRLNSNGTVDATFASALFDSAVKQVEVQEDDKMYVVLSNSGNGDRWFKRLNSNGSLDTSFSSTIIAGTIKVQPDNKILITYNDESYLKRLNYNGSIDTSFINATNSVSGPRGITDIFITSDGRIVVKVYQQYNSTGSHFRILNQNGTSAGNFVPISDFGQGYNFNATQQDCDKFIISGHFSKVGENKKNNIARITLAPITPAPPTGNGIQNFSTGQTLANLTVVGENIQWYATQNSCTLSNNTRLTDSETPLPLTTLLTNGMTYHASQTISGTESYYRLPITVTNLLSVGNHEFSSLKIFPNPVKNQLTLSNDVKFDSATLYDIVGKKINEFSVSGTELKMDISHLKTGIYILKITKGEQVITSKIIKE